MKWLKSRNRFLNEAKIRDVIHPKQAEQVAEIWGEEYLDYEEVEPTKNIKQGVWKLSEEDKLEVLSVFFGVDLYSVYEQFNELPDRFHEVLKKSLNIDLIDTDILDTYGKIIEEFDIKNNPSIEEAHVLFENIFRKLSVNETKSNYYILKDDLGRPEKDENNNLIKVDKEVGEPIFTNNLVNIKIFIADYNSCYPDESVNSSFISVISPIRNRLSENFLDSNFEVDFDIFNKDLELKIEHKAKDILNISISKFFSSCQNLYSGSYNELVLSNVFDINSIPAFLKFNTPIYYGDELVSEQVPICRLMIRDIEDDNGNHIGLHFDRCYPDKLKSIFSEMINKYSGNVDGEFDKDDISYAWAPDVDEDSILQEPYMDTIRNTKRYNVVGRNVKKVTIKRGIDWSRYKFNPNSNLKELVIDSIDLPDLSNIKSTDLLKIRLIELNNLTPFKNIEFKKLVLDKCKIKSESLDDLKNVKNLELISCDVDDINLDDLNLESIGLIFSLDTSQNLKDVIGKNSIKNLKISSDVLRNKDNKDYINTLKSSGVKVEIVGPKI